PPSGRARAVPARRRGARAPAMPRCDVMPRACSSLIARALEFFEDQILRVQSLWPLELVCIRSEAKSVGLGEGRVDKTVPVRYSADETFDIGMDTGSPVSPICRSPNEFTGKIKKVTIDLKPVAPAMRGEIDKRERDVKFKKAMSD